MILKTRHTFDVGTSQEEKCESKYDTKCETEYATEYEEVRKKFLDPSLVW